MRKHAIITAIISAVTLVGLSGASVFADTTTHVGTAPAKIYVTVQQGDYLAAIAAKHSTTYVRIFDANQQIVDPDLIYPGEVLRIPSVSEQLSARTIPTSVISTPVASTTSTASSSVQSATPVAVSNSVSAAPVATPSPATVTSTAAASGGSIWDEIAQCESSGDWSIDTGNGFYGGLQFTLSSWRAVGGTGYPNQASRDEQIMRAELLQAQQGWGAWPVCSAQLGL